MHNELMGSINFVFNRQQTWIQSALLFHPSRQVPTTWERKKVNNYTERQINGQFPWKSWRKICDHHKQVQTNMRMQLIFLIQYCLKLSYMDVCEMFVLTSQLFLANDWSLHKAFSMLFVDLIKTLAAIGFAQRATAYSQSSWQTNFVHMQCMLWML